MQGDPSSSDSISIPAALEEFSRLYGHETVIELIDIYIQSSEDLLRKIAASRKAGDLNTIHLHAHSLKSASANLGAMRLSETSKKLEKARAMDEECAELIRLLDEEWPRVLATLEQWKSASRST